MKNRRLKVLVHYHEILCKQALAIRGGQFSWWQSAVYTLRFSMLCGVPTAVCQGKRYKFERGVWQKSEIHP
jgi:hypothetical protein